MNLFMRRKMASLTKFGCAPLLSTGKRLELEMNTRNVILQGALLRKFLETYITCMTFLTTMNSIDVPLPVALVAATFSTKFT